jgi:Tol biopolymer transport system component
MKSMSGLLGMSLLVAVVYVSGCPKSSPPLPPGQVGGATGAVPATRTGRLDLVVFSSNRSGLWAIWSVKPDASALSELSRPGEGEADVDPCVSPDGTEVLFTSTRGGPAGLWTIRMDGNRPRRICDGDQGEWSPDGTRVVFRRGGRLIVRELAGGRERTVSPAGWEKCSGPAWSPDGNCLAFALLGEAGNAVYVLPAGGGDARLVYGEQGACEPHWSPDGSVIVYETEAHLFAIRPDGTKNRPLTWYGGVQRYGRFSPDGKNVVFCQAPSPEGPWELYTVPSGGGTPARLTEGGSDMYPEWR